MPLYIAQSGDLDMPEGQTLKDRATQLPIKYKSGTLVTQCRVDSCRKQMLLGNVTRIT